MCGLGLDGPVGVRQRIAAKCPNVCPGPFPDPAPSTITTVGSSGWWAWIAAHAFSSAATIGELIAFAVDSGEPVAQGGAADDRLILAGKIVGWG